MGFVENIGEEKFTPIKYSDLPDGYNRSVQLDKLKEYEKTHGNPKLIRMSFDSCNFSYPSPDDSNYSKYKDKGHFICENSTSKYIELSGGIFKTKTQSKGLYLMEGGKEVTLFIEAKIDWEDQLIDLTVFGLSVSEENAISKRERIYQIYLGEKILRSVKGASIFAFP